MKYHITESGLVRKCVAKTVESCRAKKPEGLDKHFSDVDSATKAYEESRETENVPHLRKPLNLGPSINVDTDIFNSERYVKESVSFIEQLDEKERNALSGYVNEDYDEINKALYSSEELPEEFNDQIVAIDSALSKYEGRVPKVLWKSGVHLNKVIRDRGYKVGDVVDFGGYSSTSETTSGLIGILNVMSWYMKDTPPDAWQEDEDNKFKIKVPNDYKEKQGRNTVLCIRPKNAAPVSMLRGHPTEQEWLINRGGKFIVSEIYEDRELTGSNVSDGTFAHIYVLDEV